MTRKKITLTTAELCAQLDDGQLAFHDAAEKKLFEKAKQARDAAEVTREKVKYLSGQLAQLKAQLPHLEGRAAAFMETLHEQWHDAEGAEAPTLEEIVVDDEAAPLKEVKNAG